MAHSSSAAAQRTDFDLYHLTDFRLQSGVTLPQLTLAYKTYGELNAERSNVILYPTSFGAQHPDIDWLIGPGNILDSSKYFIVIPNMFGNGFSTSPSNFERTSSNPACPEFHHIDNVDAQRQLLQQVFQVNRLALIYGWSMGGQQALHWATRFPDAVERVAAICTSARTTPHNRVFLEGLKSILTASPDWNGHEFANRPEPSLRAFGRVYAGWALSQAFYREHLYLTLGYSSLEHFLVRDWEASFLRRDAANLLSMIQTWMTSDVSAGERYQGNLQRALSSIQAQVLIMPGQTDLYFTPEDSQLESKWIPHARFLPIPSIWGHRAGNPAKNPDDQKFIKAAVHGLLGD